MYRLRHLRATVILTCFTAVSHAQPTGRVDVWLSNRDRSQLVNHQAENPSWHPAERSASMIQIDDTHRMQTVDGFGFALTGGSAQLLHHMSAASRHALLRTIFGRGAGKAGVSYLRVSIGASDMNDHVFTYDDLLPGEADPALRHFSLHEDEIDLIPVLREIQMISPKIQILATPWSAPSWMKTTRAAKGGSLKPEFYVVYANYLIRYLKAMQARGVSIAAITIQNEPLNPKNTPSMMMEAAEEDAFLRDAFGPKLRRAHLKTRLILFDHNCDRPDYPLAVLSDARVRPFVDGSGFHLYEGEISAMSDVHDAYPSKNIYFTEQMVVEGQGNGTLDPIADPVSRIVIGAMRNWSRNVLLWNLAADQYFGPHTTDGGCPVCQGAITIDGDKVTKNIAFHTIVQVSRFVSPGSIRIDSTQPDASLANVAWQTPAGKHVIVISNTSGEAKSFKVGIHGAAFAASLEAGSVATYTW